MLGQTAADSNGHIAARTSGGVLLSVISLRSETSLPSSCSLAMRAVPLCRLCIIAWPCKTTDAASHGRASHDQRSQPASGGAHAPGLALFERYYRELLNFCLGKTRNREAAADLAQESVARVLAMQQAGQAIQHPGALLRRVATHAKIDLDRRAAVRDADDIDSLAEALQPLAPLHLQPEQAYASAQVAQAYVQAIASLPPRCREAFSLHVFDEMPKQEIADRMGVSLSMVKQYVTRGKAVCAACRADLARADRSEGPPRA